MYVKEDLHWELLNSYIILGGIDMSNTINVGGMTGYYNSFIQSVNRKNTATKTTTSSNQDGAVTGKVDFMSAIDSKTEVLSADEVKRTEQTEEISTKDMTLEEYKKYIYDTISSFSWCSDKMGDNYSINISDEGFKAMQNDPEYEKWVLNDLKTAFATPLPGWVRAMGGKDYVVVHYGATKEECSCTGWSIGYQGGNGDKIWEAKSRGSFWSKRGEDVNNQKRQEKKLAEKKRMEKDRLEEAMEKRKAYSNYLMRNSTTKSYNDIEFIDKFSDSVEMKGKSVISAYEANLSYIENI